MYCGKCGKPILLDYITATSKVDDKTQTFTCSQRNECGHIQHIEIKVVYNER